MAVDAQESTSVRLPFHLPETQRHGQKRFMDTWETINREESQAPYVRERTALAHLAHIQCALVNKSRHAAVCVDVNSEKSGGGKLQALYDSAVSFQQARLNCPRYLLDLRAEGFDSRVRQDKRGVYHFLTMQPHSCMHGSLMPPGSALG